MEPLGSVAFKRFGVGLQCKVKGLRLGPRLRVWG